MKAAETALFKGIVGKELSHLLGCIGARERDFAPGEALLPLGETRPHAGVLFAGGVAGTGVTGVPVVLRSENFFLGKGAARLSAGPEGDRAVHSTDRPGMRRLRGFLPLPPRNGGAVRPARAGMGVTDKNRGRGLCPPPRFVL